MKISAKLTLSAMNIVSLKQIYIHIKTNLLVVDCIIERERRKCAPVILVLPLCGTIDPNSPWRRYKVSHSSSNVSFFLSSKNAIDEITMFAF